MEEYDKIPEKGTVEHAEYINEINYEGNTINVLKYWEEKIVKGKEVRTEFQWITSIKITNRNAEKMVSSGRKRWKKMKDSIVRRTGRQISRMHVAEISMRLECV